MSGLNREKGLEKSDGGALNPEQRSKLRQLKVDVQKLDEKYIRVRWTSHTNRPKEYLSTKISKKLRKIFGIQPKDSLDNVKTNFQPLGAS